MGEAGAGEVSDARANYTGAQVKQAIMAFHGFQKAKAERDLMRMHVYASQMERVKHIFKWAGVSIDKEMKFLADSRTS